MTGCHCSGGGGGIIVVGVGQFGVSMCAPLLRSCGWCCSGESCSVDCVLVDTEPKALRNATAALHVLGVRHSSVLLASSGAANNFAMGYLRVGAADAGERAFEEIRKILERSVFGVRAVIILHSLAGGTGSGVGTALTQRLSEEHIPSNGVLVLNVVAFPHSHGDVSVQSFNSTLALSKLAQVSDGIVVCSNDDARDICSRLLDLSSVSLPDMNHVIARNLASVLCPAIQTCSASTSSPSRSLTASSIDVIDLHSLAQHMFCHVGLRFACVRRLPEVRAQARSFTNVQWPYLSKHLRQMQMAASPYEEGIDWSVKPCSNRCNRAISIAVFLRGQHVHEADVSSFEEAGLFASYSCTSSSLKVFRSPVNNIGSGDRLAAAFSNDASIARPMQELVDRGYRLLAANAFVHQYEKYGLEKMHIQAAIDDVDDIVAEYNALSIL